MSSSDNNTPDSAAAQTKAGAQPKAAPLAQTNAASTSPPKVPPAKPAVGVSKAKTPPKPTVAKKTVQKIAQPGGDPYQFGKRVWPD